MQIKFSKEATGSLCNWVYVSDDNSIRIKDSHRIDGNCHGIPSNRNKVMLLFTYNNVVVTEDEFQQWIDFCNSCGFKSSYSIKEFEKTNLGYSNISGKYYTVILDSKDYVNDLHLFAAITVLRMISYRASDGRFWKDSQTVIKNICNLIEKNPEEKNPLKFLLLAHRDCLDNEHFLLSEHYDTISNITVEEMIKNFKSNTRSSLNSFFSKINPKSINSFKEIIW